MDLMQQENKADDQWTVATTKLPENSFASGKKAITEPLPYNSNLCLWKKIQSDMFQWQRPTLSDAIARTEQLSHCTQARPIQCQTCQGPVNPFSSFAGQCSALVLCYCRSRWYRLSYPQYLPTDLRPDIIVWNDHQIHPFELTVCWEGNFQDAASRKEAKYLHLLAVVRKKGTTGSLQTRQIGSRGFLDVHSLNYLTNTNRITRHQYTNNS